MSYSLKEINEKLLQLFGENGEHWTKGAYVRTKDGLLTTIDSGDDYSFCLHGALMKLKIPNNAYCRLSGLIHGSLISVNDSCANFAEFRQKIGL